MKKPSVHIIEQKLQIKEWPLKKVGDKKFFGYVVSLGIFPNWCQDDEDDISYVDFAYNNEYTRYHLPEDEDLRKKLLKFLTDNLWELSHTDSFMGKVWIELTEKGYEVDLP